MKKQFFFLLMAVFMFCFLSMTSCSAAEIPADSGGLNFENEKISSDSASGFTDVPADAWYADAISYCQQNGIMSGTATTTFKPDGAVTRAMLAAVLYRMSGSPAVSDPVSFTDAKDGAWYADAIAWAAKNNVISGYGNGSFGVNDPATREQAVTILWRYAGSPTEETVTGFSDMASVSDWAKTAVRWADADKITDGMAQNGRFNPKANITRGEVASMLFQHLKKIEKPAKPIQPTGGKTLVAYFSATNTTRPLAEYAADILNANLYEIVPKVPYTDTDLAYYTSGKVLIFGLPSKVALTSTATRKSKSGCRKVAVIGTRINLRAARLSCGRYPRLPKYYII